MPRFLILPLAALLMSAAVSAAQAGQLTLGEELAEKVVSVKAGSLEILAIEDSPGRMDIDLFKGPLGSKEKEAILPDGYAPASVNVLVVKAQGQIILIDSGYGSEGHMRGRMLESLSDAGITPESVDLVILTHLHFDHIVGLLAEEQAVFPNAQVRVSAPELGFWQSPDLLLLEGVIKDNALQVGTLANAYSGRFGTFEYGAHVTPLITAVDAHGHTPGHTAFLIESGEDKLLVIGDLLHGAQIQFPYPAENTEYDLDQGTTQLTRKAILNRASEENLPVAGMHIPWPGMGYVKKDGKSGFLFEPLQ